MDLTKAINLKHVTIGSLCTTIILLAGTLGALQILKSCGHDTLAQPALEDHAKKIHELHMPITAPIMDSLKKRDAKLENMEKSMEKVSVSQGELGRMFLAPYSKEQRRQLRARARQVQIDDSLDNILTGGGH